MKTAIALTALATSLFALTPAMAEETMGDSLTVTQGNPKENGYEDSFFVFNEEAAADANNYFRLDVEHKSCSKNGYLVTTYLSSRFKRVNESIPAVDIKAMITEHYKKTMTPAFGRPLDEYVETFLHSQITDSMWVRSATRERIDYPLYSKELRNFSAAAISALENFKNTPPDSGVKIVYPSDPILGPFMGFGGKDYADYDNPSPLCKGPG